MAGQPVQMTAPEVGLSDEDARAGFVLVKLGPKARNLHGDTDRTGVFYEADHRHPTATKEVLVVDGRVVKVYPTEGVRIAEARGLLVQVRDEAETPTADVDATTALATPQQSQDLVVKVAVLEAQNAKLERRMYKLIEYIEQQQKITDAQDTQEDEQVVDGELETTDEAKVDQSPTTKRSTKK